MTFDNFKRVAYEPDGEAIDLGDANDAQTFLEARIFDQLLHGLIGNVSLTATDPEFGGKNGADAPTHLAYCLHGGSAYLRAGSGINKLQIAPGTLLQKVAAADGDSPQLLAYTFAGTEEVTIANGDATHPRVDILQMKLEIVDDDSQTRHFEDATTRAPSTQPTDKKTRVQCTLSVKQGAPLASPVYPDPDAGYVAVAGIVVGTLYVGAALIFGYDSAGTNAVVHDQRMPLNVQGYTSDPTTGKLVTAWALTAGSWALVTTNATNDLRLLCPKAGRVGRIVGISLTIDGAVAPGSVDLLSNITNDGSNSQARNVVTAAFTASPGTQTVPYYTFEGTHSPQAGPVVLPSATNKIGPPMWTSGDRCAVPVAAGGVVLETHACLRLKDVAHPTILAGAVWHIAQGI